MPASSSFNKFPNFCRRGSKLLGRHRLLATCDSRRRVVRPVRAAGAGRRRPTRPSNCGVEPAARLTERTSWHPPSPLATAGQPTQQSPVFSSGGKWSGCSGKDHQSQSGRIDVPTIRRATTPCGGMAELFWNQPHLSAGGGAGSRNRGTAATGAVVPLETVEATPHPTAASHRVGDSPRGGEQSQPVSPWLLVDERNEHRAARVTQRVVAETGRAGLAGTMDRTALRTAELPCGPVARQSDRNPAAAGTRMTGGLGAGRSILPATRLHQPTIHRLVTS